MVKDQADTDAAILLRIGVHLLPNVEFRSCFIFVINTEHMAEPLQLSEFEHSLFRFKSQNTLETPFQTVCSY